MRTPRAEILDPDKAHALFLIGKARPTCTVGFGAKL